MPGVVGALQPAARLMVLWCTVDYEEEFLTNYKRVCK